MNIKILTLGSFQTNTYVITNNNESILIDCGENINMYKNYFDNLNIKGIFLTHGHFDHIDGLKFFNDKDIYIYKDEYDFLTNKDLSLYSLINKNIPFDITNYKVHLLSDNETINIIGLKIKVIHTPGHTKGSCCYLIDDKLFTGDTLFCESFGRYDFPTGNLKELRKSINKLLLLDESIIIYPGHDESSTILNEKLNNPIRYE